MDVRLVASAQNAPDFLSGELHVFARPPPDSDSGAGQGEVELHFFCGALSAMTRAADEPLKKALRRIELTLQKKNKGGSSKAKAKAKAAKGKQKATSMATAGGGTHSSADRNASADAAGSAGVGAEADASVAAAVFSWPTCWLDGQQVPITDESPTNADGWRQGMRVCFPGGPEFTVVLEPPVVRSLGSLPTKGPTVGFPVVPTAAVQNCTALEVMWLWEPRAGAPQDTGREAGDAAAAAAAAAGGGAVVLDGWESVEPRASVLLPAAAHVGAKLKAYATPLRATSTGSTGSTYVRGRSAVVYVAGAVEAAEQRQGVGILHTRRAFIHIAREVEAPTDAEAASARTEGEEEGEEEEEEEGRSTGRHFAPLFGPGCAVYPAGAFVNNRADSCAAEDCVSNASGYHMGPGRVQLLQGPGARDYCLGPSTVSGTGSSYSRAQANPSTEVVRRARDFRLVCYNILADPFATSATAITQLFSYCDRAHLASEYRLQRLVREMAAYDADVLLLQECDEKAVRTHLTLLNALSHGHGSSSSSSTISGSKYNLYYTGKDTSVPEGCCTIVNTEAFDIVGRMDLHLGRAVRAYLEASSEEKETDKVLWVYLQQHPQAWEVLTAKLGMIAQVTVLRHRHTQRYVCISNTHLFYHPAAGYVRLLQCHIVCTALHAVAAHIRTAASGDLAGFSFPGGDVIDVVHMHPHPSGASAAAPPTVAEKPSVPLPLGDTTTGERERRVDVLFAGDLNSTLETAAVEYLQTGGLAADHPVWDTLDDFRWDRKRGEASAEGGGAATNAPAVASVSPAAPGTAEGGDAGTSANGAAQLASQLQGLHVSTDSGSIKRPCLQNPFSVSSNSSGAGLVSASGYPQFTNFTGGFKDLLDYVFMSADSGLDVLRTAPLPSEEALGARTALPSAVYPSDHVALALDLTFS